MLIERISPFTGKLNSMEIDISEAELEEYYRGTRYIQDVFPHLTADEREFIMTGIHTDDWPEE